MVLSFKNIGTEDIFNGKNTKNSRQVCPQALRKIAVRKLDQLDSVTEVEELKVPPNNRLKILSGNRDGEYSIRINDQYRICFVWHESGAKLVEIADCH